MARSSVRIGVIGVGFGATVHIPAFQSEGLDVVAVCARRQERATEAAQRFGISKTFTDYRKMLQMDGLDAVSVVSPVANHYQMTMEALDAGKHIICEKPFTQTAREAENLVAAVNDSDAFIAEAFKFRHHPMHLKARELIDAGAIGDVMTIRSTFYTWGGGSREEQKVRLDPDKNWRFNKLKGIHHARWTFGEDPVEVFATCRPGVEVDVAAHIQFVFPSGGVAQIGVGFDTYSSQEFHIIGESGSLQKHE